MKVHNFAGFMKSVHKKRMFESDEETYMDYSANPEEGDGAALDDMTDDDQPEEEGDEDQPEVTIEDLKAMIEDLTQRIETLEGGGEEEEEEPTDEEPAEGEEEPAEETPAK